MITLSWPEAVAFAVVLVGLLVLESWTWARGRRFKRALDQILEARAGLNTDTKGEAEAEGAKQRWVTPRGYTQIPDAMRAELKVGAGAHIWFLRGPRHWEAWTEAELDECLGAGEDDDGSEPIASVAAGIAGLGARLDAAAKLHEEQREALDRARPALTEETRQIFAAILEELEWPTQETRPELGHEQRTKLAQALRDALDPCTCGEPLLPHGHHEPPAKWRSAFGLSPLAMEAAGRSLLRAVSAWWEASASQPGEAVLSHPVDLRALLVAHREAAEVFGVDPVIPDLHAEMRAERTPEEVADSACPGKPEAQARIAAEIRASRSELGILEPLGREPMGHYLDRLWKHMACAVCGGRCWEDPATDCIGEALRSRPAATLDELAALAPKTRLPWMARLEAVAWQSTECEAEGLPPNWWIDPVFLDCGGGLHEADARYIVAACNVLPALLARLGVGERRPADARVPTGAEIRVLRELEAKVFNGPVPLSEVETLPTGEVRPRCSCNPAGKPTNPGPPADHIGGWLRAPAVGADRETPEPVESKDGGGS